LPSGHKEIHATVLLLETEALARCHTEAGEKQVPFVTESYYILPPHVGEEMGREAKQI